MIDRNGVDIIGVDGDGYWWGTDSAYVVLGDHQEEGPLVSPSEPHLFEAAAYLGSEAYSAFVAASSAERVREWLASIGARDVEYVVDNGPAPGGPFDAYGDVVHLEAP